MAGQVGSAGQGWARQAVHIVWIGQGTWTGQSIAGHIGRAGQGRAHRQGRSGQVRANRQDMAGQGNRRVRAHQGRSRHGTRAG
jgi:hypothetical protein